MKHPNDPGWQRERADLERLADELLACGNIDSAQVLRAALIGAHLRGQEFALKNVHETMLAPIQLHPAAPVVGAQRRKGDIYGTN